MNNNSKLKFRYYDSALKRMVYSEDWSQLSIFFEWANNYAHDNVIMQFTGIQDKNKNDIYENDIIQGLHDFGPAGLHIRIAPVFWHNIHGYQWNYWNTHTLEIIGNTFQNPNLVNL